MLRSLSSGVSGLKAEQTQMDVIGNNIANVNTTAFKSSRVTFKDVFYQTLSTATGGSSAADSGTQGGTNPMAIGYGTAVSSVDVVTSQSGTEATGKATDLYINGEGYFAIKDSGGNTVYTRNGNFNFDASNNLVDANGNYVCGWTPSYTDGTDPTPINISSLSDYSNVAIGSDGKITGTKDGATETLGQIALAKFVNPQGLSQTDGVYFNSTANSGTATITYPGSNAGTVVSGELETSNVDLSNEMTSMITAERGFQANSRVITVSDEMLQELVNLKRS